MALYQWQHKIGHFLALLSLFALLSLLRQRPNPTEHKDEPLLACASIRAMPENLTWNDKLGVYLDGETPILWTYYDYPEEMTNLMRLSLGTISCHNNYGLSIIIATDEEVVRLLGSVHAAYHHLSPNHKSDYFRVHILEKYGGAYVDLDVIALGPSVGTYAWLRHYDMVGQIHGPVVSVGYLGPARARNRLFTQWAAAQDALLSKYAPALEQYAAKTDGTAQYPVPWSAVIHVGGGLRRLFTDYLRRRGSAVRLFDGTRFTAQLSYSRADFNQTTNVTSLTEAVTLNRAPFVYWHNALLAPMWPMGVDEIFASDFLFVELLARSHSICRSGCGGRPVSIRPGRLLHGKLLVEPARPRAAHDGEIRRWADEYSERCLNMYLAGRQRAEAH